MTKVLAWITAHVKLIVIIVGAFLVTCVVHEACKASALKGDEAVLAAQITTLQAQAKLADANAAKVKAAQDAIIAQKDKDLAKDDKDKAKLTATIKTLQGDYATLDTAYAAAKDCPSKLEITLTQITNQKRQIADAGDLIAVQDKMIAAWGDKFNAQLAITNAVQGQYNALKPLYDKEVALNSDLAKSLRLSRLTGTIKTGLVAAGVGYVVLHLVGVIK
jgi:hypothetical protein